MIRDFPTPPPPRRVRESTPISWIVIGIVVLLCLLLIFLAAESQNRFEERCRAAGGEPVPIHGKQLCFSSGILIKIE